MLEGKNVNRINAVHINVLILVAFGLNSLFNYFKNTKTLKRVFVVCYAVSLMFFSFYYFGKYNSDVKDNFRAGAKEAVEFVNEKDFKVVCVDYYMYYPQLLFFDETPTKWFLETVKWNYRGTFSSVKSFTKYTFNSNLQPTTSYDAFIIPNNDYEKGKFVTEGYLIEEFEEFAVAYKS